MLFDFSTNIVDANQSVLILHISGIEKYTPHAKRAVSKGILNLYSELGLIADYDQRFKTYMSGPD
jgi:hypothetical protein